MLQNQNLQLRNTYDTVQLGVGSPPPTLACPHCLQHFHSKGGRTKHIRVKHHTNGHNLHASSHSPSHNVQFEPSPIQSDSTPSPPPSCGEVDADNFSDIDILDTPQFDHDYIQPDLNVGDKLNKDLLPRDDPMEQPAPDAPHITHFYHPKL